MQTLRGATRPREEAELTDGQLLECYVRGREETAFAALVGRHGPMVWGVCRRVLRSQQDAEDAFQASFLVLVRRAASVMPRELVANWLYGVAHQTALKARAIAAKRGAREKQVTAMPEPAVESRELWDDLQPVLDEELSLLPDKYRAVIALCDLEGKTRKEVARQLKLPEGTVASRLATARTMLAKRLARHGLAVSGGALAGALAEHAASAGVPNSVASAAIKTASLFSEPVALAAGAGVVASGEIISHKAALLAEGVVKNMLLSKLKKLAVTAVVGIAVLGTGSIGLAPYVLGEKPAERPAAEKKEPAELPVAARKAPAESTATTKKEQPAPVTMIQGIAKAVDASKGTLTVTHQDGDTTFIVTKDARIDIDYKPSTLGAVPVGANIIVSHFVDATTTRNVQANGRWFYNAPVKAVDVEKNKITIGDRDGDKTFGVGRDAIIAVDGKQTKLAAVPAGAVVNLGLAADQTTVCNIGAEGPCLGDCHGSMIKAIDPQNRTITFDDKERPEIAGKTFTVAKDAIITIDGKGGTLSAVPGGSYVTATLTVDQTVVRMLRAQGPSVGDCHGSLVKAVDTVNYTITFDEKAGASVAGKTFAVARDAGIQIDGKLGSLSAIPAGCYADLTLSADRQMALRVNAQGPSNICDCGGSMVTAVDTEKGTITFDDRARAEVAGKTFFVAKDANIIIDNKRSRLSEVPVGAYVNIGLSVDRQTATNVHAQGPAVTGIVKALDVEKRTMVVGDETYTVASDAWVVVNGNKTWLAALPVGANVRLNTYVDRKTVCGIQTTPH
jgi:RNA polymerase sigma factor (sigma-70 family)